MRSIGQLHGTGPAARWAATMSAARCTFDYLCQQFRQRFAAIVANRYDRYLKEVHCIPGMSIENYIEEFRERYEMHCKPMIISGEIADKDDRRYTALHSW